jgi:predicted Fe-Mo cluster-binding NifX family protein
MKILLTSEGRDLNAALSPAFGRCPWFLILSTDTDDMSPAENPAFAAGGGAGVKAAQFVVESGVDAVVTGRVGPHAMEVLDAAGIRIFDFGGRSARAAVDDMKEGRLEEITSAAPPGGRGLGRGRGR